MNRIFDLDNGFFRFMGKLADVFILNLLWVFCCIPVVTIGASTTAMYYVTLKMAKDEEGYIIRSFFKSFFQNLKQSLVLTIIALVSGGILIFDLLYFNKAMDTSIVYKIIFYVFCFFSFIYVIAVSYIFPLLARFDNTIKNTIKNSFLIGMKHFPQTVSIIIIEGACAVLFYLLPITLLFIFALCAFFNSYFFVKVFENYMPKEEHEGGLDDYDAYGYKGAYSDMTEEEIEAMKKRLEDINRASEESQEAREAEVIEESQETE